jgi:transcription antitermination factor NusG
VIWTESRAEKKVEGRIAALGLSPWLPTVKERRRWSDRWREVASPLFPGYLFARARSVEWHKVLRTPGVLTVVKQGGRPALLADGFIAGLRDAIERNGAAPEPVVEMVDYGPGDDVVIVQEGALKGVRGVVRERRSGRQLVIWVSEIGRGVAFTIGPALVKAASQSRRLIPSSSALQASRAHFTRARNFETPESAHLPQGSAAGRFSIAADHLPL